MIHCLFLTIRLATLRAVQRPFSWLVWRLEQSITRQQTILDNEKAAHDRRTFVD